MKNITIFASGNGTNAQAIIDHLAQQAYARVALIVVNKPEAYVIQRAKKHNIPVELISRKDSPAELLELLARYATDFIVLAGYLALIPSQVVATYSHRIINLHPALLPKFGGKGMFGEHVHTAVLAAHEKVSGITIHYVDEQYDTGFPILQASCPVNPQDTPQTLAERIHLLEHRYLPFVLNLLLNS